MDDASSNCTGRATRCWPSRSWSLEWLAGMSDHIPDPGQHCTLFYGEREPRPG